MAVKQTPPLAISFSYPTAAALQDALTIVYQHWTTVKEQTGHEAGLASFDKMLKSFYEHLTQYVNDNS